MLTIMELVDIHLFFGFESRLYQSCMMKPGDAVRGVKVLERLSETGTRVQLQWCAPLVVHYRSKAL